jgi:hypothetical protein
VDNDDYVDNKEAHYELRSDAKEENLLLNESKDSHDMTLSCVPMFLQVSFLKRIRVDPSPSACKLSQAPDPDGVQHSAVVAGDKLRNSKNRLRRSIRVAQMMKWAENSPYRVVAIFLCFSFCCSEGGPDHPCISCRCATAV